MGLAPYALSVHHFISSVGADAGFASIIGLAVLVLLYFAQARETSSLRDQADQAAQVESLADGRVRIRFDAPQRAVTPGQYAVLYVADRCIGGAVIDAVAPRERISAAA